MRIVVAEAVLLGAAGALAAVAAGAPSSGDSRRGELTCPRRSARATAGVTRDARDPEIRLRYGRGDMQLLTRHAVAGVGSHEESPERTSGMHWLAERGG